ncbi:MAG: hypothetical protein H6R26_3217, partial [Proteobacteria bacterium]|nr:hypothetical protein [Pseudomonadota bacterium]
MSHVSSKVVLGLAAAALIAMVAATVTSIARKPVGESARSFGYALPALHDHVN